jgi:hypothetical protein
VLAKRRSTSHVNHCHTAGFGKPGGIRYGEETPEPKASDFEVGHGPGDLYAESGDPAELTVEVSMPVCDKGHNFGRVAAFGFKPILSAMAMASAWPKPLWIQSSLPLPPYRSG